MRTIIAMAMVFMAVSASAGEVVRSTVQEMQSRPGVWEYLGEGRWRRMTESEHLARHSVTEPREAHKPPERSKGDLFIRDYKKAQRFGRAATFFEDRQRAATER